MERPSVQPAESKSARPDGADRRVGHCSTNGARRDAPGHSGRRATRDSSPCQLSPRPSADSCGGPCHAPHGHARRGPDARSATRIQAAVCSRGSSWTGSPHELHHRQGKDQHAHNQTGRSVSYKTRARKRQVRRHQKAKRATNARDRPAPCARSVPRQRRERELTAVAEPTARERVDALTDAELGVTGLDPVVVRNAAPGGFTALALSRRRRAGGPAQRVAGLARRPPVDAGPCHRPGRAAGCRRRPRTPDGRRRERGRAAGRDRLLVVGLVTGC